MVRSYYAHLLVRKQRVSGAEVLRITFCVTPVTKDYFNVACVAGAHYFQAPATQANFNVSNSPNELWFHNAEFYFYFISYYNRILLLFSFNLMLSQ